MARSTRRQYDYTFRLHPRKLPVQVWVGHESRFGLDFPHVWTGKAKAHVWYPPACLPVDVTAVAHEGVHLAAWGLETLAHCELGALIPKVDMCWDYGRKAIREEAMARMVDRFVANFYHQARLNGLRVAMPKVKSLPQVVDDPAFYQ